MTLLSHHVWSLLLLGVLLASCGANSPDSAVPVTSEPLVQVTRGGTERIAAEVSNPVLNNCGGTIALSRTLSRGRSTTVVINLTISADVEADLAALKASLETSLSVREGETITSSDAIQLGTEPGTRVTYQVQWYETWAVGSVDVLDLGISIPYRVRQGFDADIIDSVQESCGNATDTRIPTQPPSPTATATQIVVPRNTSAPAQTSFPCAGIIVSTTGAVLNQIHLLPSQSSPTLPPVDSGKSISITGSQLINEVLWLNILYDNQSGWIPSEYVRHLQSCSL